MQLLLGSIVVPWQKKQQNNATRHANQTTDDGCVTYKYIHAQYAVFCDVAVSKLLAVYNRLTTIRQHKSSIAASQAANNLTG